MKRVLNVGAGASRKIIPAFEGWEVVRLDIDQLTEPDIVMDARDIGTLAGKFDAVYCSHNLEHYTAHDAGRVVRSMRHVLKSDGFVDITVPNVGKVLREAAQNKWDLDTFLYQSAAGPVTVCDMLYGHQRQIELSDNPDFMTHRSGYSVRTLPLLLSWCGFPHVYTFESGFDLGCLGFLQMPSADVLARIGSARE